MLRLLARLRRGRRPWGVLEDETRWVQGLLDLAQGMSSEGSFDTRLGEVCRVARELIGCDRSSIFLLEDGAYRAKFNAGNPPHVAKLYAPVAGATKRYHTSANPTAPQLP